MSNNPFEMFKEQIKKKQSKSININDIEKTDEMIVDSNEINLPDFDSPTIEDIDLSKIQRPANPTIIPINLDYVFMPKPNITTLELARILAFTQLSISSDLYEKMPSELKAQFAKYQDIIESEKKEE